MNLDSIQFGKAIELLRRTTPILLMRLGVMLGFWLVALVYLLIVGGVSLLIGAAVDWLGFIIFIIALVSVVPMYQWAYRYVFYMIKAAHIAVMAEYLDKGKIKDTGQLTYGRRVVTQRFGELSAMFVVDELVDGVVRAFTRTVNNVMRWLPGDTIDGLVRILNRIIGFAMSYIDEAILARSFWHDEQNVWENARDGVVLYAQTWQPILTSAVALMVLSFVPGVVVLVLFAAPIGGIIAFVLGAEAAGWTIIALLLLAWVVKVAIGDAFAIAAIIATYYNETKDLQPNPEMAARLDGLSEQFGELRQRAEDSVMGRNKREPSGMPVNTDLQTDAE